MMLNAEFNNLNIIYMTAYKCEIRYSRTVYNNNIPLSYIHTYIIAYSGFYFIVTILIIYINLVVVVVKI